MQSFLGIDYRSSVDLFPNCQHCIISAGFICDAINGFLNRENIFSFYYSLLELPAFSLHIIFYHHHPPAIYSVAIDMFLCAHAKFQLERDAKVFKLRLETLTFSSKANQAQKASAYVQYCLHPFDRKSIKSISLYFVGLMVTMLSSQWVNVGASKAVFGCFNYIYHAVYLINRSPRFFRRSR